MKHAAIGLSSVALLLVLFYGAWVRAADKISVKLLCLIVLVAGVVAAQSAPPRKDIPAIAKAANGVVVSIITSDKEGKPVAQGTGFLVSKDGRIVTNYHVINGASSAIVKLPDGAFYDVDGVVAFDKARDLAVIKAHGQNFRVVTLGNSDRVQVGEEIVAIGSPLSLESTVSSGIVSGIRTIQEEGGKFLQVTAPISPGSSGGPLFNMEGEVVGITTLYLKGGENLNFAIPVNDAKRLLSANSKVQDFPSTQIADPKTLSEILDWIQTHFDTISTTTHNATGDWHYTDTFGLSFENCQVTVTFSMDTFGADNALAGNFIKVDGPFDLGGLRSESEQMPITHEDTFYRLRLYSVKPFQSKWTQATLGWTQKPETHDGAHNFMLLFATQDMAERQQEAWHDAIILCGGKKTQDDLYPTKQSASNTKERSDEAYVITAHTVVHDENTNSQLDNYVIVHGSEILKVQYAESQTSTVKQGASLPEFPIQGKDLHLHFRYRVWPQEPDVSQVPHIGVPIRACEMDTNYPGSVEHPWIAIQSVAAPCMSRNGDTLHYAVAPNDASFKMYEYVDFDILSDSVATADKR
ncbi:MAG: trypsin-like peptidase domain-containing protein [Candidatus Acidiferrales bacterium]